MFYVAYRTLLVMFVFLNFILWTFMECLYLLQPRILAPTWRLKMHVLCKVWNSIIFQKQNITSNVLQT